MDGNCVLDFFNCITHLFNEPETAIYCTYGLSSSWAPVQFCVCVHAEITSLKVLHMKFSSVHWTVVT